MPGGWSRAKSRTSALPLHWQARVARAEIDMTVAEPRSPGGRPFAGQLLGMVGDPAGMRHSNAGEGTGSNVSMLSTVRGSRKVCVHGQKPGNADPGHSGRHEKPRAELTGAAGSHTSSTGRVRHCWLADVDFAPAFVRHNHAVSWTARDDTGWLHGPWPHPRGHGGAIDCGSRCTCFPTF